MKGSNLDIGQLNEMEYGGVTVGTLGKSAKIHCKLQILK
jgi:hypothetical protein